MSKLLVSLLFVCGCCTLALAQMNEGRNAPARPGSLTVEVPSGEIRAYSRTVTGKVLRVETEDNVLVIEDLNGKPVHVILSKDTRLKADKKTELADKHDLTLADYKAGQFVKLTLRIEDNKVLEVRLKPPPKN